MRLEAPKMNMAALADALSRFFDRPVVDLTELKGTYQWRWISRWRICGNAARTMGMMGPGMGGGRDGRRPPTDAHPIRADSRFSRPVQQLGLKLEPRKVPIDLMVNRSSLGKGADGELTRSSQDRAS